MWRSSPSWVCRSETGSTHPRRSGGRSHHLGTRAGIRSHDRAPDGDFLHGRLRLCRGQVGPRQVDLEVGDGRCRHGREGEALSGAQLGSKGRGRFGAQDDEIALVGAPPPVRCDRERRVRSFHSRRTGCAGRSSNADSTDAGFIGVSNAIVIGACVSTAMPTLCGRSDSGVTGVATGPAWAAGCWLKAAMTVKQRAATVTRVMARCRLSRLPSDANGVADKAARSVRIGRNRQSPWGLHTAVVGTRAVSGTRGSIAHGYQTCQTSRASRRAPRVG